MKTVELNQNGVKIGGEYKILLVSSFFYFRIPMEKWEDRMKTLKSAGYNAIDVYFPWNYHEIKPDTWIFQENRDIDAFLTLAEKNDIYVIARPGPYICSEWDGGGIPAWLYLEDIPLRQNEEEYIGKLTVWYEKVMSIIRKHQITRGGSVVLLQLENELDFYNCSDPSGYLERLAQIAKNIGMEIPFLFCCGQDDMKRSGGESRDISPAFNIYSKAEDIGLEERCLHLYDTVHSAGMPFLVTETNRQHSYLKRLLCCGAKMLSPYNQTAGTNMDYHNAITNWGTKRMPLALISSDYDFESMIGSDGTLTNEYLYARLFRGLLNSFEGELANAIPVPCEEVIVNGTDAQRILPCLSTMKGKFVPITNYSKRRKRIKCRIQNNMIDMQLAPLYTALLPIRLKISSRVSIVWSNYEVAFVKRESEKIQVALYGMGNLKLMLDNGIQETCCQLLPNKEQLTHFDYEDCEFLVGTAENVSKLDIPGITPSLYEKSNYYRLDKVASVWCGELQHTGKDEMTSVSEMEKHGQFRGTACYEIEVTEKCKLMLTGLADLISIYKEEICQDIFYSMGETKLLEADRGNYRIVTESWGHSNFEDIRVPSLIMGSRKGIEKIIMLNEVKDITQHWSFTQEGSGDETFSYNGKHYEFITDIDGYNKPVSPLKAVYRKEIYIDENSEEFILHFSIADCMIDVFINEVSAGQICPRNPYMNITDFVTPGNLVEICLKISRRYYADRAGKVKLLCGSRVRECKYRNTTFEGYIPSELTKVQLPFSLAYGREQVVIPELHELGKHDLKLIFHGQNMILTVSCNHHIVGRIVLDNTKLPKVAGGKYNEVFICREWLTAGKPVIKCQSISEYAVLNSIELKEI